MPGSINDHLLIMCLEIRDTTEEASSYVLFQKSCTGLQTILAFEKPARIFRKKYKNTAPAAERPIETHDRAASDPWRFSPRGVQS